MVISVNPEPNKREFQNLLDQTLLSLKNESKSRQSEYLSLLGNKLEKKVFDTLCLNANGTPFDKSIELVSGQRFPDIVAKKYFGVEVKTTKSDHWKSIGSSVAEGTRVEGVERIFMLFGKMCSPIDFMCRPYEECLSEVVVTHSPRYQIDMNLKAGETIFDKIKVPYDDLRKQTNPIKTIIDYYKSLLKKGESTWWSGDHEPANKMIIRLWNHLSSEEKEYYMIKGFCLFPELLSNRQDKFNRFAIWLSTKESIVCPNVRDIYTAGGTGSVSFKENTYSQLPQIFIKLNSNIDKIKVSLNELEEEVLNEYWESPNSSTRFDQWCSLIIPYLSNILDEKFPIEGYLNAQNG